MLYMTPQGRSRPVIMTQAASLVCWGSIPFHSACSGSLHQDSGGTAAMLDLEAPPASRVNLAAALRIQILTLLPFHMMFRS